MSVLRILLLGCIVAGAYGICEIDEAIKCLPLFRSFPILKHLPETRKALYWECRMQSVFYDCLKDRMPTCYPGSPQSLPKEIRPLYINVRNICTEGNELRQRYLTFSPCMNKRHPGYCLEKITNTFDKFGVTVTINVDIEKIKQCVKVHYIEKCGEETADFFLELMSRFHPIVTYSNDKDYRELSAATGPHTTIITANRIRNDSYATIEQFADEDSLHTEL